MTMWPKEKCFGLPSPIEQILFWKLNNFMIKQKLGIHS